MEINLISYVPAIVGLVSIGIFVLLNAHSARNIVFAFQSFFISLWLTFLLFADISHGHVAALWLLRFALFFGQIMFLLFYYFTLLFPYSSKINIKKLILYSLPMVIIALLLLTPLGVSSVSFANYGVQPEHIGFVYTFSDIIGILYLLTGVGILLMKYRKSDFKQKKQIKFVLIGLSIALVVNIFTGDILTLLHHNTVYVDFGGFSVFVFSLFVAYAMFKHGFLDIRLIVARTMAYVLTLFTIAAVYSGILFGILSRFVDLHHVTNWEEFLYIAAAVFISFTFQPLKQFFDKLSNSLFYRDAYDPQVFLDQLNKVLVSTYELRPLLQKSSEVIGSNLKPSYCVFVVLETENVTRHTVGSEGHLVLTENTYKLLIEATRITKLNVIFADTLEEKYASTKKLLQKDNIAVVAKLSSHERVGGVGYLILGPKKSGNFYNSQDKRLVEIITNELVIAVQNALRFEEIQNFNLTLQGRVDDATRKLRSANEKLKALDETKDDFISMASHQLRTPLTSVKGYISMVLEGDAGKVNSKEREMLGQAFFSSQRMVYLIADLLNVSRLKTGKFVIERNQVNLATMVAQELEQLKETAASRHLTLTYDQPDEFPDLMLDETKTRQVIMNFVDNAIYYTPSGGHIIVRLLNNPHTVELRVEDDGIGVPKSEQPHMFTKFYRAGNARKARPDGTGLGLFMAKKVVSAQGGATIFNSEEGKGSTFGFTFSKAEHAVQTQEPTPVAPKA